MSNSVKTLLAAGLLSLGHAVHGAPVPALPAPHPLLALAPVANTGYITGPALVSPGMANITVFVPTQAGASYQWGITGGTIPGVSANAAA